MAWQSPLERSECVEKGTIEHKPVEARSSLPEDQLGREVGHNGFYVIVLVLNAYAALTFRHLPGDQTAAGLAAVHISPVFREEGSLELSAALIL